MRKTLVLIVFAVVNFLICFSIVDLFIVKISIYQWLLIEIVVIIFHTFYNSQKDKIITHI